MNWRLGRTWWVTILTLIFEGVLGILTVNGVVEPDEVVAPAIAAAAAAASHNLGRAWEDGKRNGNVNTTSKPPPHK